MHHNPFDQQLEDIEIQQRKQQELWEAQDKLIHKVFKQNKDGAELLKIWRDKLIMSPTVTPNATQFEAGINEGNKEFIRNICLTIDNIEGKLNA